MNGSDRLMSIPAGVVTKIFLLSAVSNIHLIKPKPKATEPRYLVVHLPLAPTAGSWENSIQARKKVGPMPLT